MTSASGDGPGAPAAKPAEPTLSAKEAQYDIVKATQVRMETSDAGRTDTRWTMYGPYKGCGIEKVRAELPTSQPDTL